MSIIPGEDAPFDPVLAEWLLEGVNNLVAATDVEGGESLRPQELELSASFLQDTVGYLSRGVANLTLEGIMTPVGGANYNLACL